MHSGYCTKHCSTPMKEMELTSLEKSAITNVRYTVNKTTNTFLHPSSKEITKSTTTMRTVRINRKKTPEDTGIFLIYSSGNLQTLSLYSCRINRNAAQVINTSILSGFGWYVVLDFADRPNLRCWGKMAQSWLHTNRHSYKLAASISY